MDQFHSQASQITCGIPQGSILGPFLFIMFVNDLPLCILNCNIHLFADDTNIYFCGDNINIVQTALQKDLDNIFKWCELNRLIINPLKTKAIVLCTPQKKLTLLPFLLNLKVNKCATEHVNSFKLLGIIIDEHLTWKLHINNLCSTLSCTIAAFWKINKYLDFNAKVLYYNGYILSRLLYSANVWSAAAPKYLLI